MRLFEERVGIRPSYIYEIEKGKLLPSPEKLDLLASVFVEVATEQRAADPDDDARQLFRERERSAYVDRLGFPPEIADVLVPLAEVDEDLRAEIAEPLEHAIRLFGELEKKQRQGVATLIREIVKFIQPLNREQKIAVGNKLAEALGRGLDEARGEPEPALPSGDGKETSSEEEATELQRSP